MGYLESKTKQIIFTIGFFAVGALFIGIGAWASWVAADQVKACQDACSASSTCNDNNSCQKVKTQVGLIAGSSFAVFIIVFIVGILISVI